MRVEQPWGLQCLVGFPKYKYCPKCGNRIFGYPNFCGKCRTHLEYDRCPYCSQLLGEDDKFYCPECGYKLK